MTNKTALGSYQNILFAVFLLVCFGAVFYTYYKPTTKWFRCPDLPVTSQDVCSPTFLKSLKVESFNLSFDHFNMLNYSLGNETKPTDSTENKDKPKIMVLIWKWPFGNNFESTSCEHLGIPNCHFTSDRTQLDKAHAVMFHHRDLGGDVPDLLKISRPIWQKWVWMNMESPSNSQRLYSDNIFNLTSNYRSDSDLWLPYGRIVEAPEKDQAFEIPPKDKLVCWIVSNWNNAFKRVQYYNALKQYINIEIYGRPFQKYVAAEDYSKILSSCKFYLSFENSIHQDYFTEKLFNPLTLGTVPVVLGPSRENYEEFIPADSFIHVDDFKTPQELAERIKFLDQNKELYEQYFNWRKHYVVKGTIFAIDHACHICEHVRTKKGYRVFKNLNKWYWD